MWLLGDSPSESRSEESWEHPRALLEGPLLIIHVLGVHHVTERTIFFFWEPGTLLALFGVIYMHRYVRG